MFVECDLNTKMSGLIDWKVTLKITWLKSNLKIFIKVENGHGYGKLIQ